MGRCERCRGWSPDPELELPTRLTPRTLMKKQHGVVLRCGEEMLPGSLVNKSPVPSMSRSPAPPLCGAHYGKGSGLALLGPNATATATARDRGIIKKVS